MEDEIKEFIKSKEMQSDIKNDACIISILEVLVEKNLATEDEMLEKIEKNIKQIETEVYEYMKGKLEVEK